MGHEIPETFEKDENGDVHVDEMVVMKLLETGNWSKLHEIVPNALSFMNCVNGLTTLPFERLKASSQNRSATHNYYAFKQTAELHERIPNLWQLPLIRLMLGCGYRPEDVSEAIRTAFGNADDSVHKAFNAAANAEHLPTIFKVL